MSHNKDNQSLRFYDPITKANTNQSILVNDKPYTFRVNGFFSGDKTTQYGNGLFQYDSDIKLSLCISGTNVGLGDSAMSGSSITKVVIPKPATFLGSNVFNSSNINTISLPYGITTIDSRCFN